jgi:hypothetical protein
MRMGSRLRAIAFAVVVVGGLVVLDVGPAGACSCSAREEQPEVAFVGTPVDRPPFQSLQGRWTFSVHEVIRGGVGEEVQVSLSTEDPPDENGMQVAGGCSLGPSPLMGGIYEVEAYLGDGGEADDLFANSCAGSLTELAAPPDVPAVTEPRASDSLLPYAFAASVGMLVVVVVATLFVRTGSTRTEPARDR